MKSQQVRDLIVRFEAAKANNGPVRVTDEEVAFLLKLTQKDDRALFDKILSQAGLDKTTSSSETA